MFNLYNLDYTGTVFIISLIATLANVVVQLGKYFCVEPFYSFTKSKFYNSTEAIALSIISLFCTVICTIGILINNLNLYFFGAFIATVLTVFYIIIQLGTVTVKLLSFIKNYHHKLYNKRFGEKND